MVLLYEPRRHRLGEEETPLVFGLIVRELSRLYKTRSNVILAEELYKIFYRMKVNQWGRPCYPAFTWKLLGEELEMDNGPFIEEAAIV